MNEELKHAIELFKQKRYTINSERNIDVDTHNVQEVTKAGRTILLCDCENHTKFCNQPTQCRHKLLFIVLPLLEKFDNKLSNLILEYDAGKSGIKDEKTKSIINQFINDLDNLRNFR